MGTESTSNHARMQTSLQLHTSERRQKNTNILVSEVLFADDRGFLMRLPMQSLALRST